MISYHVFFGLVFIALALIYILMIKGGSFKSFFRRRLLRRIKEDAWERFRKIKEMDKIDEANIKALGNIKLFLADIVGGMNDELLNKMIIPEFNRNAPDSEKIPLNLTGKKLRRTILEKAEQYHAIHDPLLQILAESFVAQAPQKLGKKTRP